MAEGDTSNKWHTDPLAVLIFFILMAALISGVLNMLNERFNFDITKPEESLGTFVTGEINGETSLGTRIRSTERVRVLNSPGDGIELGEQPANANGVIIDGPVTIDSAFGGTRWWSIDFAEDPDGWVSESALEKPRVSALIGPNTKIGSRVRSLVPTELFSAPRIGALIGFQPAGSIGTLLDGPSVFDSVRWWNVGFEDGSEGWVTESALELATLGGILSFVDGFKFWFTVVSLSISAVLAVAVTILILRINRIRYEEIQEIWGALPERGRVMKNEKWEHILELVNSDRPAEWRQAIIEADIMLDDLISNRMMIQGETMGAKLDAIEKSDFNTIDLAWEAHRVRNKVAHAGTDYILTQREARRVIDLYRQVFAEFGMV